MNKIRWYVGVGFSVSVMMVCLFLVGPVEEEWSYIEPNTGVEKTVYRSFFFVPGIGECWVSERITYLDNHFRRNFYPDHDYRIGYWEHCGFSPKTVNLGYRINLEKSFPNWEFMHENGDISYFVFLYNKEPEFRAYIKSNLEDGSLDLNWFLDRACKTPKCPRAYTINMLDPNAKILLAYKPSINH